MSASAPAGKMTRKPGSVVAACTRPTMNGDIVSCVISQPEPTFCIQVPVYEIPAATQSERKRGSCNGAQAEPFAVLGNIGVLTMSAMLVACNLFYGCVLSKRPLPVTPGPQQINDYAADQDQRSVANLSQRVRSRNQYEHKSNRCSQRRQRVKPHAERPRQVGPADAQHDQANRLQQKLQHNADHHQPSDYVRQR